MTRPVLVAALVVAVWICVGLAFRGVRRAELRKLVGSNGDPVEPPRRGVEPRAMLVPLAVTAVGFALWGLGGAMVGVVLVPGVRWLRARQIARVRTSQVDEQLADLTGALASAVRAGMSVPQALRYAAREAEPPLKGELVHLVEDIDVGVRLDRAVTTWTERIGTDDAYLLGAAFELHRRAGGDLPSVLDQVGAAIRDRVAAAREVRALTAQARLSGLILGLLPIGFFAFLWLTSRRDIEAALGTSAGRVAVVLGLVMETVAFMWIRRLLEVT